MLYHYRLSGTFVLILHDFFYNLARHFMPNRNTLLFTVKITPKMYMVGKYCYSLFSYFVTLIKNILVHTKKIITPIVAPNLSLRGAG